MLGRFVRLGGGQGRPGRIEQGAAYAGGNDKHDKQQVLEGCRERMRLHVGHDSSRNCVGGIGGQSAAIFRLGGERRPAIGRTKSILDRKSTRMNSSHYCASLIPS